MMRWLESVWSDLRYAVRGLRRTPVFTAVAVVTLALGIGATSAIFSLVDGILLRPLPFPQPDRLVTVMQTYPAKGLTNWPLSQPNVVMYRDRTPAFASFAAYTRRGITYTGGDRPERLNAARVTAPFFTVLGVSPLTGRAFTPAEDAPGNNDVAILAYGFWQSHFAGDRNVVGKTLDLDGRPTRVVGVMPRGFGFPRTDIVMWLPLGLDPSQRFGWFLTGIARLKPSASVDQAFRQTTALMANWMRDEADLFSFMGPPQHDAGPSTVVVPLRDAITGDSQRPLAILQAAVVLILLIATANVATLLSGRATARTREMGLRAALGATRSRLVRQLLTESVVLALAGAALGVALAALGVRAFTHSSITPLPRLEEVTVNARVLLLTIVVSVASGLLFGLSPVVHSLRDRLTGLLAGGQRETSHTSTRRVNDLLVIAQLALSVVLLVSAGLVLKSFHRLLDIDLGFQPANVTDVAMALPNTYDGKRATTFATALLDRVRAVPGVRSAAVAWNLPYSGSVTTDGFVIEGHTPALAGKEMPTIQLGVTPGYFATLGMALHRGRDFSSADRDSTVPVVVVDEALARRYWLDGNAIGKRMQLGGDTTWRTIVGVVAGVRDEDPASEPRPHSYFPLTQSPGTRLALAVQTSGDSRAAIASVRAVISGLEPGIPLDGIRPLSDFLDRSLDHRRVTQMLLVGFALLAATLAAVGIYGVMSLYVAHRGREFGIRLAVGAEPRNVIRLVLREGLLMTILGLSAGVVGALLATRWIRSLLFDVSATDPIVFIALPITLGALAVAFCYIPARRAAKSDPMQVMRAD
jgi:putative ABC transport system permease protein